jgi:uncharacterized protein (TIGR00269 family)
MIPLSESGSTHEKPVCTLCGKPAVIFQPVTGRYLCAQHLVASVDESVAGTLAATGKVTDKTRIAVALSGGKDSTALLVSLVRAIQQATTVSLIAITVDEGIAGYRADTIRAAQDLTKRLGVEHRFISFTDIIGDDLDTILAGRESRACTICGILRRKALARAAQEAGATVVATGHNLDDEAQSVLMNAMRGDLPRLLRDPGSGNCDAFIPRIKPLSEVPEKEIAAYLFVQGIFPMLPECPYTRYALRAEVRSMLALLENTKPGTMENLIRAKKTIEKYCGDAPVREGLHPCRDCGEPCSSELCQFCRLRQSLGK